MDFISRYLDYTKNYESPTSFWKWSAYATLAGILRDSCYIRQQNLIVYPNIYILFLAQSGVDRKGLPTTICEHLVKEINNTKVISGRTSIQALVADLANSYTDKNGKLITGGSALFIAPELSAGLVGDSAAVGILTDIYDARGSYTNSLKGAGKFEIKNVCVSMLGASNIDMLKGEGLFDSKGIFGGLLARTFLIKPDEFRSGSSLFNTNLEEVEKGMKELMHLLREIQLVHGPILVDGDAQKEYDAWYMPFRDSQKGRTDKSGVNGRIHTSILKLSIIICINRTRERIIRKSHIEEAIDEAMVLLPNYQEFIMGAGRSSTADIGTIILQAIYAGKEHRLSRKNLLQKHWNDFDAETLDKIITTLTQGGLVMQDMDGNECVYRMTEKCIEILFPAGVVKEVGK